MADETKTTPEEPQGTDWKAEARKHEKRSKENKTALDKANAELESLRSELESLKAGRDDEAKAKEAADEKAAKDLAEARAEIQRLTALRERDERVRAAASKAGVDPDVLVKMVGDSDEEIASNVELLTRSGKRKWPVVEDDGASKAPRQTKEEILAIKDPKEQLRAIAKNKDLFK